MSYIYKDKMQVSNYNSATDEQQLCLGLKQGEEIAFAEIYDRYFNELYTRAYKVLGVSDGAEDAVQETFMALWKYHAGLDIQNLGAYLNRAVRNAALKAYQLRKTDAIFFERLAKASNELLSADPLVYKELQQKLAELIKALPADQQLVYTLSREQKFTNQQIADHMQISVKTVEKKMTLLLKYLRTELVKALVIIVASQLN